METYNKNSENINFDSSYCEDELCPNCWGHQEYNDDKRDILEDEQVNVNNHLSKYSFIQRFIVKYIQGIQLKNIPKYH